MKIVLDTNVLLAAFLTQGVSWKVLSICIDKHILIISPWILEEFRSKLKTKFKVPDQEIKEVERFLSINFIIEKPMGELPDICRDQDDNNILHLAEYAGADLIITGDTDLLDIQRFKNTLIISPRTFMSSYTE